MGRTIAHSRAKSLKYGTKFRGEKLFGLSFYFKHHQHKCNEGYLTTNTFSPLLLKRSILPCPFFKNKVMARISITGITKTGSLAHLREIYSREQHNLSHDQKWRKTIQQSKLLSLFHCGYADITP